MTVTKSDRIEHAYQMTNLKKADAIQAVENKFEIIKSTLPDGESILISGFGKFEVKDKAQRKVRTPQTGEDFMLDRRKVVTFQYSSVLKEKMNDVL